MATILSVTMVLLLALQEIIRLEEEVVNAAAGLLIFTSQRIRTVSNNCTHRWPMIPMNVIN